MSSHNEQVKPAAFDVATPAPEAVAAADGKQAPPQRPAWVVPTLLGLGAIAILVFFWLPGRVGQGPAPTVTSPAAPAAESGQPFGGPEQTTPQPDEASPWSDAQLAKLRKEAQDVLANLLESQHQLEELAVEMWAGEPFEQAKVFAQQGDTQYRDRLFVDATTSYEQGMEAMQVLLDTVPKVLAGLLAEAQEAIEAGDRAAAQSALLIAQALQPDNALLLTLTARAALLDQVMALVTQAETAEEARDLATAQTLLKQASALDPQHRRVKSELERITAAYVRLQFNQAMSDGYVALNQNQFNNAKTAFRQAAKLVSGSPEAASALQEVQVAQTAYRLSTLQELGQVAQTNELWQDAVSAYEEALKIDANIFFAQEGLKRSGTRAKLDEKFSTAIDEPSRLADIAIAEATETLLRQAASITPRGPVLSRQMSQLETLLKQANTVRPLTLTSDGETEVIVYKVARLGQFQQRTLTLRPGEYTAVGTRDGFRDVRVTFNLSHDRPLPVVVISCTETI
jgi:tetratricopeptide (TPR) repeat protein